MKNTSLESSAPHVRYMDFIAPKKKPLPAGTPTKELEKKKAAERAKKTASVSKPVEKPVEKSAKTLPKPVLKATVAPKKTEKTAENSKTEEKVVKKPEAPDASKYTLGGKSPFLASVNVEKRPLSSSVKSEIPKKNVYEEKPPIEEKSEKAPTKIIKQHKKSSDGLSLVIIILTIILGAATGIAAYYLLPLR